jgi:hypothetical protein
MHLESWAHNNALEEIFFQNINIGLRSMVHWTLEIVVILGKKLHVLYIHIKNYQDLGLGASKFFRLTVKAFQDSYMNCKSVFTWKFQLVLWVN